MIFEILAILLLLPIYPLVLVYWYVTTMWKANRLLACSPSSAYEFAIKLQGKGDNAHAGVLSPICSRLIIKRMALQGYPHCAATLGKLYKEGIGGFKNHKEALKWLLVAQAEGDVDYDFRYYLPSDAELYSSKYNTDISVDLVELYLYGKNIIPNPNAALAIMEETSRRLDVSAQRKQELKDMAMRILSHRGERPFTPEERKLINKYAQSWICSHREHSCGADCSNCPVKLECVVEKGTLSFTDCIEKVLPYAQEKELVLKKEEEIARKKAEEEAHRKAEEKARQEAEIARKEAERMAREKAQEEARKKAEAEAKRLAKEEAARKKEEELARKKAEAEARKKAEAEAKRLAKEEEDRKKKEELAHKEAEAKRLAELKAKLKAEMMANKEYQERLIAEEMSKLKSQK